MKFVHELITIVVTLNFWQPISAASGSFQQPVSVSAQEYGDISKSVHSYNSSQQSSSEAQVVGDLSTGKFTGNGTLMVSNTKLYNSIKRLQKDHALRKLLSLKNPTFDRLLHQATHQNTESTNSLSHSGIMSASGRVFGNQHHESFKVNSSIISVLNEVLTNNTDTSKVNFKPTVINVGGMRKHGNKVLNNTYMTLNKTISIQNGNLLDYRPFCFA